MVLCQEVPLFALSKLNFERQELSAGPNTVAGNWLAIQPIIYLNMAIDCLPGKGNEVI
jgi:hypothetical protein